MVIAALSSALASRRRLAALAGLRDMADGGAFDLDLLEEQGYRG